MIDSTKLLSIWTVILRQDWEITVWWSTLKAGQWLILSSLWIATDHSILLVNEPLPHLQWIKNWIRKSYYLLFIKYKKRKKKKEKKKRMREKYKSIKFASI